jgi:formylmethanofuran dehydrogenase subunit A
MIVIRGAEVYDPANGVDGRVRDLWIDGDRIASAPRAEVQAQVIDGHGMILAPAGVEIHTHVAGYGLNDARRFLAGDPDLLDLLVPSASQAAQRYLAMGYTTVFDAASLPSTARLTASDLFRMSGVDRGTFTQLGDHRLLLNALMGRDHKKALDILAWLLRVSGGFAVKLVNPGGGIAWKSGHTPTGLDDSIGIGNLTQRKIIQKVGRLVEEMGLPHPIHLHARQLGEPGNSTSFCKTIKSLNGLRAHLCHIQFYSYGQDAKGGYTSAAEKVVQCLQENPRLTCDIGQIMFGEALAISSDTSGISALQKNTGSPWISRQIENDGGINTLCLNYKTASASNSVQFATGLELMLLFSDSSRFFLTTDHPNGAPFDVYPQLIEYLMSRPSRQEMLHSCHSAAVQRTGLASIEREYTLGEIITMTSWGPAKALGLCDRGQLGPGALADVRCYRKQASIRGMFAAPAWVMRRGKIVVKEGKVLDTSGGSVLITRPKLDEGRLPMIHSEVSQLISILPDEYGLGNEGLQGALEVPCRSMAY